VSTRQNLRILASAGTGKTFRLTNRFLGLLFDGVEPERILATTFTRKAAGEILDRVLERLTEACVDADKRAALAKALNDNGELSSSSLTEARCVELLAKLTRNLNAFQVRTIDSFFVHLVQLFALDLELPPDWGIADERVEARLRAEALQDVLSNEDPEAIVLLLRELSKGEAGRSVHGSLVGRTAALRPVHLESAEGAWDSLQPGAAVSDDDFGAALGALEGAEVPASAKGEPNKTWLKARSTFVERARDGRWEELLKGGLGGAFLSPAQMFSRKPFPDPMVEPMETVMQRVAGEILARLAARNQAADSLMNAFEAAFERRKRTEGAYGFGDLPYALAPNTARALPLTERELDQWFRLDGRIDHLLLDEFQDTAPVQWRILAGIAGEIVAGGDVPRSLLCVGDTKQSIYSFRQAEPRLLSELTERLPGLENDSMAKSYRSAQAVLDAVNLVFEGVAESSAFADEEFAPYRRAAEGWTRSYESHTAARTLTGAVYAVEARAKLDEEPKQIPLLERAVERVRAILDEAPHAEVGILLRKNAAIPSLIHRLRAQGIDASGEGGNPLTDARAVLCFLSLLHLADFPDDSAAAFHVASSELGPSFDLPLDADADRRRALSRELRQRIAAEGLGEFTRALSEQIVTADAWTAWDRARFGQLLDLAFAFEASGESRPSAFVDVVRASRVEAPGGSNVRVMTVHASKGLEFDAVVLPEIAGPVIGMRDSILTERPDPSATITRATIAPSKDLLPISADLQELYDGLTERQVEDALSVLYVAMTRAKRRLDLILPGPEPETKSRSSSGPKAPKTHELILDALAATGDLQEADEAGVVWSHGDGAAWSEGIEEAAVAPTPPPRPQLRFAEGRPPRSLPRRSPSAEEGGGRLSAADALRPRAAAQLGTLVHACFEAVVWLEDFGADREAVEQSPALRRASGAQRAEALALFDQALGHEEVAAALSRARCAAPTGSTLEVQNEARFSIPLPSADGALELWTGAIDRLVLARSGDEVVWAEVLDFKSDQTSPGDLDGLTEHYRPQLEAYSRFVQERYGLAPGAVVARLVFVRAGLVRTV